MTCSWEVHDPTACRPGIRRGLDIPAAPKAEEQARIAFHFYDLLDRYCSLEYEAVDTDQPSVVSADAGRGRQVVDEDDKG